MNIWSLEFNNNKLDNFPQVIYKTKPISIEQEIKLIKIIFKIFYLTHRDKYIEIKEIEMNESKLPYEDLYNLVFPKKNVEYSTEYLVDLLNLFQIELN